MFAQNRPLYIHKWHLRNCSMRQFLDNWPPIKTGHELIRKQACDIIRNFNFLATGFLHLSSFKLITKHLCCWNRYVVCTYVSCMHIHICKCGIMNIIHNYKYNVVIKNSIGENEMPINESLVITTTEHEIGKIIQAKSTLRSILARKEHRRRLKYRKCAISTRSWIVPI